MPWARIRGWERVGYSDVDGDDWFFEVELSEADEAD